MDKNVAEFVIYIINAVSDRTGVYTSRVFSVLDGCGFIDGYLVECYDVLHTLAPDVVVDDLLRMIEKRGESL